ncbi:MAG: lysozyme inhibitor [Limnobacter sp.]|nr:lysozyme inhibitor [Limnobacter sp.]
MRAVTFSSLVVGAGLLAVQLPSLASDADDFNPHKFPFPAGLYDCELNRKVDVREVSPDMRSAVLRWARKDYTLRAVKARTGALRYEDESSGLVWIVIAGKSMLLDMRHGKQLANECTARPPLRAGA